MILIPSPYLFLKNVIFRHGFVDEFLREFRARIQVRNSYEFAWIRNLYDFLHENLVMLRMVFQFQLMLFNSQFQASEKLMLN